MASEYRQIADKGIEDRVRAKYQISINQLKRLNFEELCLFGESSWGFGLSNGLLGPLGVLAALPSEVIRIGSDLTATAYFLLLVSREYDTYVSSFGLGTKFYTSFTDGTCVITANFDTAPIHDDQEKLYKFAQPCPLEDAWRQHQAKVAEFTAKGKQRKYHLSFDEFARLAHWEDTYMLKPKPLAGAIFRDTGSTVISTIIFLSLLLATVFLFLLVPTLVHGFYPACWFVRNLGKPSAPVSGLIALAGITVSWILARLQKGMFLVDAAGTALHGQRLLPDRRSYISTKWLVFMFLPILPVRSYRVLGEYSSAPDKKYYSLEPLDQLDWAQIGDTLSQYKWWYLFAILLWMGLGAWTLLQCS